MPADTPGHWTTGHWTTEQVLALAPDAASTKRGRELATPQKWQALASDGTALWGTCQGSGKTSYQTQIDLREPAFRCSCPSRKFPCKHGLGLFLLLAEQPDLVPRAEPPDWVAEWLTRRSQAAAPAASTSAPTAQATAADPKAQAKRAAAREAKVQAGVAELQLWLSDRLRQGLATLPPGGHRLWQDIAARMVDAQAPGLARRLRRLADIDQAEGADRIVAELGWLHLLLESYGRLESLPPAVQADVRSHIGWTLSQEEVLTNPNAVSVADVWRVLGQRTEPEDQGLKVRRTWLQAETSGKLALLLDFAQGNRTFELVLPLGQGIEAELVFYPSAYPQRAVIKHRQDVVPARRAPAGQRSIGAAIAAYGQACASCPWLELVPLVLTAVTPQRLGQRWWLRDAQGIGLPLATPPESDSNWQLLALSGGHPVTVLGEWDGAALMPLSVWVTEDFYGLSND